MKFHPIALVLSLALPLAAVNVQAQTAAAKKSAAANKPAAAKTADAKKPAAAKPAATKRRVPAKTAKAVEAVTPVQSLSERLSETELAIAQRIYTGTIPCEMGVSVTVTADENNPGFFQITAGKQRYYMHPVESRTGALRLEDGRVGAMWLQLGNKSMLMNQKLGQRVADECATPTQREFATHMKESPQPSLLDGPKP